MSKKNYRSNSKSSKSNGLKIAIIISIVVIFIVGIIVLIVIANTPPPQNTEGTGKAWDTRTTIGNPDAKNHMAIYGDAFCPYCHKEIQSIRAGGKDFQKDYIDTNKIYYEYRITDAVDPRPGTNNEIGGSYVMCATKQNKFWEYFYALEDKLDVDYYSKGKSAISTDKLSDDYFTAIAKGVKGLDVNSLTDCVSSGEGKKLITDNTVRANNDTGNKGMPVTLLNGKVAWSGMPDDKWSSFVGLLDARGIPQK
jgi:protein-disulfide isomerase